MKDFGVKDASGQILLKNINIELQAGDSLLIQGASGTGKTTLLKALAGFIRLKPSG
ncbi:ABC transporter ATP-binding protein [Actinobacillus equuli]|nr:ABC transporter ATP-binding protein [Actinobacillus equuli]